MSAMDGVRARGLALAERAAARRRAEVLRDAEAVSGVTVSREGDDVVIEARGLLGRIVAEPELREIGRGGGRAR